MRQFGTPDNTTSERRARRRGAANTVLGLFFRAHGLVVLGLFLLAYRAAAFSLIGPYADWMDLEKGYGLPGDMGGPMDISEGYRWNVPVVTYGFDQSFLDFFGSNGVAAVDAAIDILNRLPPASAIDLQSFPLDVFPENYQAATARLIDLKTQTLTLLLWQMGLADPGRYAGI